MTTSNVTHWRKRNPQARRRQHLRQQARAKALRRLGQLHPEELQLLYDQELALIGEPPCRCPGRRLPNARRDAS